MWWWKKTGRKRRWEFKGGQEMSDWKQNDGTNELPMPRRMPRIGELLIKRGLITEPQLDEALAIQIKSRPKRLLGTILVELAYIESDQLVESLAEAWDIPFVRIEPKNLDPKAMRILPRDFLERKGVVPVSLVDQRLTIATEDFTNVFLTEEIARLSGCKVDVVATTNDDIRRALANTEASDNHFALNDIIEGIGTEDLTVTKKQDDNLDDLETAASDSPIIKLVNYIIYNAIEDRASDVHIEPEEGLFRVRYRVDGDLFRKIAPPLGLLPAVVSRIKIMAGMDIAERRVPQDGGFAVIHKGRSVDLRISTMPGKAGEKVVIRLIDNSVDRLSLKDLGLLPSTLRRVSALLNQPNGIFLVTGPTGSGKSTTLYGCLSDTVDERINVSTVEDPVEYNLAGINQFQVNPKAGFNFANALRSLLRQDPDVIMIGEIRDSETAQIAIQAALTGHLVMSTLHTNDAPSAVTRLINMGVESYLLAATLRGVMAQRLARKICDHCKEYQELDDPVKQVLARMFGEENSPIEQAHRGSGCMQCQNRGFRGRVGIYELLVPNSELMEAINHNASMQEIRRIADGDAGFVTLQDDCLAKVSGGVISIDELFRITAHALETVDAEEEAATKAA